VSELAHAYTDFFLDRYDKGFVHSDDDLIVLACRLDAPNHKYWHCLTYDQIYSKFYRLFNQVFRCCRFWNLFGFVTVYDRHVIRTLMNLSEPVSFGPGYRKFTGVRKIDICPICSSSEPDIVLEELPTEQFRFEKNGAEGNEYTRIRSDVSMLLHAADMAKKYGPGFCSIYD
jgi:hypothetical protein